MRRIGIIGVGLLGSAIAGRLLDAGYSVQGHDVRPGALGSLAPRGLGAATTVAEAAADAELVFTVLPSLESVATVVRGPDGLLDVLPRDATIIQMSTISPGLTRELGEAAAARGIGFLDAPVSGTSAMVARGDCTILVAGDARRIDRVRPVFDAIASRTIVVGALGTASVAKLATNLLVALNTAAVAEALVLGARAGLPPRQLLEILRDSAATSKMVEIRGPLMVDHRFEPQMKLDLFLKDFALMLDEGKRVGAPLLLTGLVRELASVAAARGHGSEDLAAIVTTLETMAGLAD